VIVVSPITDEDVENVVALWRSAGITRPWNDPYHDIAFARRGPHSTVLIGRDQAGRPLATAMVGEDGHRGWVYYVAADPKARGQGLGRRVMRGAEDWLAARGIWKVQLMVRGDNQAVHGFYDALGYKRIDVAFFQKEIGRQDL
jgi:ribosomal protein S18 acetylase RimI-like enzyme